MDSYIAPLAKHARVLAPVFKCAGLGLMKAPAPLKTIAEQSGIPSSRWAELASALNAAAALRLTEQAVQGQWRCAISPSDAQQLGFMLRGVQIYLEQVHQDEDTVSVVFSKPAEPSKLMGALKASLDGTWKLIPTAEMLADLALRAAKRFTVMTPFVDDYGAAKVVELFRETAHGVERRLIVRNGIPDALAGVASELIGLDVRLYDFRLNKDTPGEHETFHAKVIMADDRECYVGSSNMNKWSFEYSLELGFNVRGKAAQRVSKLLEAVVSLSQEIPLTCS